MSRAAHAREPASVPAPEAPVTGGLVVTVAGERLVLDPAGAAYAPDAGALLVADLHFEKGSSLAARGGAFLPPYDTRATLERLERLIAGRQPDRVVALGDSFHDMGAGGRMATQDRAHLARLVAGVEDWLWITGNHDPEPPVGLGGRAARTEQIGALTLRHEPEPGPALGEVAGHLHPCAKVAGLGRAVRRPCFATDGSRLILPALGAYTGGLNLRDQAYSALFSNDLVACVLGEGRVWPVPARRLRPD